MMVVKSNNDAVTHDGKAVLPPLGSACKTALFQGATWRRYKAGGYRPSYPQPPGIVIYERVNKDLPTGFYEWHSKVTIKPDGYTCME